MAAGFLGASGGGGRDLLSGVGGGFQQSFDFGAGRYAPSPTGDFHLGNLRTALLAWAFARKTGRQFLLRMEDLDERCSAQAGQRQLADLVALGLDWDGPVLYQSARVEAYEAALCRLQAAGLVYECYCTRREILEAPSAPHQPPGHYQGTCRDLTEAEREAGREKLRGLRRGPALRLRAGVEEHVVQDFYAGQYCGAVDDLVLRRGDGAWAYNLVCVVDDAFQGVDQVVRGDDLLSSAPRQAYLAGLLGLETVEYAHVPMVLGPSGARLAKRDGPVTLRELLDLGWDVPRVVGLLATSLGMPEAHSAAEFLACFDPATINQQPWVFTGF